MGFHQSRDNSLGLETESLRSCWSRTRRLSSPADTDIFRGLPAVAVGDRSFPVAGPRTCMEQSAGCYGSASSLLSPALIMDINYLNDN